MTVSATNVLNGPYAANGVTTAFPFTFAAAAAGEVAVLADGAAISPWLYSVALAGAGGTITFDAAPADGAEIVILSLPGFGQGLALVNNGAFLPEAIEAAFDRGVIRDLYLKARVDAVAPPNALIPGAGAGLYLAHDAKGNPVFAAGTGADAGLRTDLAEGGGAALIGYGGRSLETKLSETVNAADFGFAISATAAANAAALAGAVAALGAGGGNVRINAGTFDLDWVVVTIPNVIFEGAGKGATILRQGASAGTSYGMFHFQSSGAGTRIEDCGIRRLTLLNATGVFSEFNHLVTCSGVESFTLEDSRLVGFQGDGLCVHGVNLPDGAALRHNRDIRVLRCDFDGAGKQNRQCISVIDCDGMWIEGCTFTDCTRPTMPGAIDFEPDPDAGHILKNLTVRGNRFRDVGGNLGAIGFAIPSMVTLPTGVEISGNNFEDYAGTGADIAVHVGRTVTAATLPMAFAIFGNWGKNGNVALDFGSGKGIGAWGNNWENYYTHGLTAGLVYLLTEVAIADTFRRCGNNPLFPYGAAIHRVDGLCLTGSRFIDCGTGGGDPTALYFVGTSVASDNVDLRGVSVTTPEGRTAYAVLKTPGHAFAPVNNRQRGIVTSGLVNQFASGDQSGTATLTAGASGPIAAPGIAAATRVYVQRQTDGGTVGASYSVTRVNGTSVAFTSKDGAGATQSGDSSTLSYWLDPA